MRVLISADVIVFCIKEANKHSS